MIGTIISHAASLTDAESLRSEIHRAIRQPNPTLANLQITRVHYLLSEALREVTGGAAAAGANFHSWAVWGSRKAGVTIRQEDLDGALRNAAVVSGIVGAAIGLGAARALMPRSLRGSWTGRLLGDSGGSVLGTLCGAWTGRRIAAYSRAEAARQILAGNKTVLEDIGLQTARFVETFRDDAASDPQKWTRFTASLRPGPTEKGGQDLLRRAFAQYYRARFAENDKERQEALYFGNCLAVLHEHIRLQPYIWDSMPFIVRKCATKRLMMYHVGAISLSVGDTVPEIGGLPYPPPLADIRDAELKDFLYGPSGWDKTERKGVAARDWTRLRERMGYIVRLFRALHSDAEVFAPPYTAEQMNAIGRGQIPAGPL